MSSNKTANLQLNQWAATDSFLREEFNQDNGKLDAAVGPLLVDRFVFGSYKGDGKDNRAIDLGFKPKALIMLGLAMGHRMVLFSFGYLTIQVADLVSEVSSSVARTDNGFLIMRQNEANNNGCDYEYIAMR